MKHQTDVFCQTFSGARGELGPLSATYMQTCWWNVKYFHWVPADWFFLSLLQFSHFTTLETFCRRFSLVSWCDILKNRISKKKKKIGYCFFFAASQRNEVKRVWCQTHLRLRPPPLAQRPRLRQDWRRRRDQKCLNGCWGRKLHQQINREAFMILTHECCDRHERGRCNSRAPQETPAGRKQWEHVESSPRQKILAFLKFLLTSIYSDYLFESIRKKRELPWAQSRDDEDGEDEEQKSRHR